MSPWLSRPSPICPQERPGRTAGSLDHAMPRVGMDEAIRRPDHQVMLVVCNLTQQHIARSRLFDRNAAEMDPDAAQKQRKVLATQPIIGRNLILGDVVGS